MLNVIAMFAEQDLESIRTFQDKIGIEQGPWNDLPHLTLAIYNEAMDEDALAAWTAAIAARHSPFHIELTALGSFGKNSLLAIPSWSSQLYTLYCDLHREYDSFCKSFISLSNDQWFPHVGLWYSEKVPSIMLKAHSTFARMNVRVDALRVTSLENETFRLIAEYPLSGKQ